MERLPLIPLTLIGFTLRLSYFPAHKKRASVFLKRKSFGVFRALGICALLFAVLWGIFIECAFGESGKEDGKESSAKHRLTLPVTLPTIRLPHRSEAEPIFPQAVNSDLPGFGTLPFTTTPAVNHLGKQLLGGSLALVTPPDEEAIPSIYIEGAGYVPLNHPNVKPYIPASVLKNPQSDPSVVMIPAHTSESAVFSANSTLSSAARLYSNSGQTLLSYPVPDGIEPILVSALTGWTRQTPDYEILFLDGDCSIRQGKSSVQGPQAVVWIAKKPNETDQSREVSVYLESSDTEAPLRIELAHDKMTDKARTRIVDKKWSGRFNTLTKVETIIMNPKKEPPSDTQEDPPILQRAMAMTLQGGVSSGIQQVQYTIGTPGSTVAGAPAASGLSPSFRRITLNPRTDDKISILYDPYPDNPDRGVLVLTQGLNLVIEGVTGSELLAGSTVDISADSAVIWMSNPTKLTNSNEHSEDTNQDFEVYLEGNIIFRDTLRTIQAHRMYYDAKNRIAYILEGQLDTPIIGVKNVSASLRLKAEVLQQLGDGLFTAKNTTITTSQLGEPTYSLKSRQLTLNQQVSPTLFSSEQKTRQMLIAENNYVAVGKVPVFYWPWMATDVKDSTFYIKNISYGNSNTYGNKVNTTWNPFQLLNIRNRPDWLDGDVFVDWWERRGIAHGGNLTYEPANFCSIPGQTNGSVSYFGLYDKGTDNLGGSRRNVLFPEKYRYRFVWKHRQEIESLGKFKGPWFVSAQVGKVSDRNVVNHYFQDAWNTEDNATTSIGLKNYSGNSSVSLFTEYALDEHYTNANWLPRFDHFLLGQSLLHDKLTWYEHTRVGFMDYNTASAPYDYLRDGRYFAYLPWELTPTSPTNRPPNPNAANPVYPETLDAAAEVFSSRHELDVPFNVGPLRLVPYVLGEFSHWGKDRSGDDVQRLYGQGGVRLNLPFWQVKPNSHSRTWYVNGLAHKIDFDSEFSWARADQSMDNLIMTDALDNWSVEDFRRRYTVTTLGNPFSNTIPVPFDPRYYALRSGMGGNVTAGNMEIADDMTLYRTGMIHRWQTKRGPVGNRHIIDWITLSAHFNYYPQAKHNNGESIGLVDYNFLWHVGDRFSLFSSGLYDYHDDGQKITRVGGTWARPGRGNLTVMFDQLDGLINRNYLTFNVGYTMNEKYGTAYVTSYDIKDKWRNVGHNFFFTRTGEAFRIMIGVRYSEAKDDWSLSFGLEPVFMRGIAQKVMRSANNMQTAR